MEKLGPLPRGGRYSALANCHSKKTRPVLPDLPSSQEKPQIQGLGEITIFLNFFKFNLFLFLFF